MSEMVDNTSNKDNEDGSYTNPVETATYILSEVESALAKSTKEFSRQNGLILEALEKIKNHYKPDGMDLKKWVQYQDMQLGYTQANRQKDILYMAMVELIDENGGYTDVNEFIKYYDGQSERTMKFHPKEHRIIYKALKEYRRLI